LPLVDVNGMMVRGCRHWKRAAPPPPTAPAALSVFIGTMAMSSRCVPGPKRKHIDLCRSKWQQRARYGSAAKLAHRAASGQAANRKPGCTAREIQR